MKKYQALGLLLASSALLGAGAFSAEAASTSLKKESKVVSVSNSKAKLYQNSELKKTKKTKKGKVYLVDGYRNLKGKHFYRVYVEDKNGKKVYAGYLNRSDTKEVIGKKEKQKVSVKEGKTLWSNLYRVKATGKAAAENIYEVKKSYVLGDGSKYYSLYQYNPQKDNKREFCGYVSSKDLEGISAQKENQYVSLTKSAKLAFATKTKTYDAKKAYNFKVKTSYDLNGKTFYSLYQTSKGKDVWRGYMDAENFQALQSQKVKEHRVVTKDWDTYEDIYFNKKLNLKNYIGQMVEVTEIFTYGNGKKYASIETEDGKRLGIVNINALGEEGEAGEKPDTPNLPDEPTENPNAHYFTNKNISDQIGKVVIGDTTPETEIYKDPVKGSKLGKTTKDKAYRNKKVKYTHETYSKYGDFVKAYLYDEDTGKESYIGWIDRQSIVNDELVPKMTDRSRDDAIYTKVGDSSRRASMDSFENGYLEVNQEYIGKDGKEYYHLVANGGTTGWVTKDFVLPNYIGVAKDISLVHSFYIPTTWETRRAIQGVTDEEGTLLNPMNRSQVKVSKEKISTEDSSNYQVTYRAGKASKTVSVHVRDDAHEGEAKVSSRPMKPNPNWVSPMPFAEGSTDLTDVKSQNRETKPSVNYDPSNGKIVESIANVYTGGTPRYTFKTKLFTPTFLSMSRDINTSCNVTTPEGMTVIGNTVYGVYMQDSKASKSSPLYETGRIVSYDMDKMGDLDQLRQLRKLADNDFSTFKKISEGIHVSNLFYIGHGQGLSTDGKNLYFLLSEYVTEQPEYIDGGLPCFNQIAQINPNNFDMNYVNTFRITVRNSKYREYDTHRAPFNIAVKDANTFYTMIQTTSNLSTSDPEDRAKMEVWEMKRQADGSFVNRRVMVTPFLLGDEEILASNKNEAPSPQGLAYNPAQNAIYYSANSMFIGVQFPSGSFPGGRLIASVKLNYNRETEGITFSQNGQKMYMGTIRGAEILEANVPNILETLYL